MLRLTLLSVSIVLLLRHAAASKFEAFSNEAEYDVGDSYFKIFAENEDKGNTALELQRTPDVLVSGDGNSAGVMVNLSESGLSYVKDVLLEQILEEVTPLVLPDMKTRINSPIGRLDVEVSHNELSWANVSRSDVVLGKKGITVFVGHIHAGVRLHWKYKYTATYVPFPVNDGGWADVEVNGMQVNMTSVLAARNGTLRMTVVGCETHIDDLHIKLQGGASWFYQPFVNVFDAEIRAAIGTTISKRIVAIAEKLDNTLQALPRHLPIDDVSAVDVTIMQDPVIGPTFLSVCMKGEFVSLVKPSNSTCLDYELQSELLHSDSTKMVTVALREDVINSAIAVYYEAGFLEWVGDEALKEAWLNTHFWRWIIPQLYKKYPNMDMALDFSCSAPPTVKLQSDGVTGNAAVELTLLVKTDEEPLPVVCISLTVSMDAMVNVVDNKIAAELALNDLGLELKWSDIGNFPVALLQPTLRTVISRVILPILNKKFDHGFPLPFLPAIDLENVDIRYEEGYIFVCCDIFYKGGIVKPPGPLTEPLK